MKLWFLRRITSRCVICACCSSGLYKVSLQDIGEQYDDQSDGVEDEDDAEVNSAPEWAGLGPEPSDTDNERIRDQIPERNAPENQPQMSSAHIFLTWSSPDVHLLKSYTLCPSTPAQ
jgi:hypothetical protein